jgi:integrase
MPIYERTRKNGTTFYVVAVSGTDRFGKRIQRTGHADNSRKAEKLERELIASLQDLIDNGPKTTFESFLPTYLDYIENKRKKTKGSVDSEKGLLEKHCLPHLKHLALVDVTTSHIELIIDQVLETYSSQTKRHALNYLSAFFALAQKKGIVRENPCALVDRIKVDHRAKVILNQEQIERFLEAAKEFYPDWYPIFLSVLHCAFRAGEARGLKWGDIVWTEGAELIHVRRVFNVKDGIKEFPKNKEARMVPVSEELKEELLKMKTLYQPSDDDWIFERHTEFMRSEQAKVTRAICRIAGVPECTFHQLRAASITNLFRSGLRTGVVMKIAGHKRMSSTEIYYSESGDIVKGATAKIRFSNENSDEGAPKLTNTQKKK